MTSLATVITGASSGIGEALAHLFAPEQQTLVLVAAQKIGVNISLMSGQVGHA